MLVSLWLPRIALAAACLYAARKGGEPERMVASVLLATFLLDIVNHAMFGDPGWFAVNPGHVVIDTWASCVLLWVALRANRGWPLLVSASQMLVEVGHLAKAWDVTVVRKAYWAMTQLPFVFQLAVLAAGTLAHVERQRRVGRYHSWRTAASRAHSARHHSGGRRDGSPDLLSPATGPGHPRG